MKSIASVVFALVLATGCQKSNDVAELQSEATAVAKFYQPKVETLQSRLDAVKNHGRPPGTTGSDAAYKRLKEAEDRLHALEAVLAPGPDHLSALERKADTLVKANDTAGLEALIDESHEQLEDSMILINDRVGSLESWDALARSAALPPPPPPAAPPAP